MLEIEVAFQCLLVEATDKAIAHDVVNSARAALANNDAELARVKRQRDKLVRWAWAIARDIDKDECRSAELTAAFFWSEFGIRTTDGTVEEIGE